MSYNQLSQGAEPIRGRVSTPSALERSQCQIREGEHVALAKKIRGTCPAQWLCGFSLVDPEFLHQRNRERENIQDGNTDATDADILKRESAKENYQGGTTDATNADTLDID